jgi:hypothetical protein
LPGTVAFMIVRSGHDDGVLLVNWRRLLRPSAWLALFRR